MRFQYHLPATLWALVILILTMMPGKYIEPVNIWEIANLDKIAHLFVFAILMLLVLYGLTKQEKLKPQGLPVLLISFLICVSYGLLIEVMQGSLLADRRFELYDAAANTIGCLLGGILFKIKLQAIMIR